MPKPTDLFTIDLLGEIFHFNMLDKNKHHPNQDRFKETLFLINMGEDAFQYDCESKITTHPRIDGPSSNHLPFVFPTEYHKRNIRGEQEKHSGPTHYLIVLM